MMVSSFMFWFRLGFRWTVVAVARVGGPFDRVELHLGCFDLFRAQSECPWRKRDMPLQAQLSR
jgi:hypothetical protein